VAVLADADRAACMADMMRDLSAERESIGAITKADLRAALNAIDDYMNTNAATMNLAIPQPARAQLTTAQKARLYTAVIRYRWIKGA
jgi:hypothetical protein